MITLKTKVFMPRNTAEMLKKFNLEQGGLVQQTIDKTVIDYNLAYAPWEAGTMAKSAYGATQIGSGKVIYPGPYAHYQYYGEIYGPNIPVFEDDSGVPTRYFSPPGQKKHPTGRDLQHATDVNPLAGPFWFERMKADQMSQVLNNAEQLRAWFRGCPALAAGNRFRMDYLAENPTEYALYAVPSQINYRENVLGEEVPLDIQSVNYIFASKESYGADVEQNLANLGFYDAVVQWILEQNARRNFPQINEGRIKSIVPTLTAYPIQIGSDAAKYQIQLKITYRRN